MRSLYVSLAIFVASVAQHSAQPSPGGNPALHWYDAEGRPRWHTAIAPVGADAAAARPLTERAAFPALPPLELTTLDGRTLTTQEFVGRVLVLEFWASWCVPCAETLPWWQSFRQAESERGLEVITVNMEESDEVAARFLDSLDVRLPVARYSPDMRRQLAVESLPTLIIVDREGRVRARFNGYSKGLERRIEQLVEDLLTPETATKDPIAQLLVGADRLDLRWSRRLPSAVHQVGSVSRGGVPVVFAITGWDLLELAASGDLVARNRVGPGVEQLVVGPVGESETTLTGYREGSQRIARWRFGDGEVIRVDLDVHLLDLSFDAGDEDRPDGWLAGAAEGLFRIGLDGVEQARRTDAGPFWDVESTAGSGNSIGLGHGGQLVWFDRELQTVRQIDVAEPSRMLVLDPGTGQLGIGSGGVLAAAVGRFAPTGSQVAVAADGTLAILDTEDGRQRFVAAWPEIVSLAAADLDGDGIDELVVGSGKRITVLGVPALLAVE